MVKLSIWTSNPPEIFIFSLNCFWENTEQHTVYEKMDITSRRKCGLEARADRNVFWGMHEHARTHGMTHLTAGPDVCMCNLPVSVSRLYSCTNPCFGVWEVNSRVPVLSLKITLGPEFLVPLLLSSFLTGTLQTALFACFSFPLSSVLEQTVRSLFSFFSRPLTVCALHTWIHMSYTEIPKIKDTWSIANQPKRGILFISFAVANFQKE